MFKELVQLLKCAKNLEICGDVEERFILENTTIEESEDALVIKGLNDDLEEESFIICYDDILFYEEDMLHCDYIKSCNLYTYDKRNIILEAF